MGQMLSSRAMESGDGKEQKPSKEELLLEEKSTQESVWRKEDIAKADGELVKAEVAVEARRPASTPGGSGGLAEEAKKQNLADFLEDVTPVSGKQLSIADPEFWSFSDEEGDQNKLSGDLAQLLDDDFLTTQEEDARGVAGVGADNEKRTNWRFTEEEKEGMVPNSDNVGEDDGLELFLGDEEQIAAEKEEVKPKQDKKELPSAEKRLRRRIVFHSDDEDGSDGDNAGITRQRARGRQAIPKITMSSDDDYEPSQREGSDTSIPLSADEEPPLRKRLRSSTRRIRTRSAAKESSLGYLSADDEAALVTRSHRRYPRRRRTKRWSERSSEDSSSDSFIVSDMDYEKLGASESETSEDIYVEGTQPEELDDDVDVTQNLDEDFKAGMMKRREEEEERERVRQSQTAMFIRHPPESKFQSPSRRPVRKTYSLSFGRCISLYCRAIQKSVLRSRSKRSGNTEGRKAGDTQEERDRYIFVVDKTENVTFAALARNNLLDGRWQTRLLQALDHRPYMQLEDLETDSKSQLEKRGPPGYCEACHYRRHTPEYVLTFSGPRTTPQKMRPMYWEPRQKEDLKSEEEEEEEVFYVGAGCGDRTVWYHRAVWLRCAIALKAEKIRRTRKLKKYCSERVNDILRVAKDRGEMKKFWARKNLRQSFNVYKEIEADDENPWITDDDDNSLVSISSSDESLEVEEVHV